MDRVTSYFVPTRSGIRLAADRGGADDGPLIVLLHGGGQTRHSWSNVLIHLVDAGYGVLCYDARGHGESDWAADGDYRLAAYADDVATVLSGEQRPIVLVGASLGGLTAFYATGRGLSVNIQALVLVDIVINVAPVGGDRIRSFMTGNPDGFTSLEEAGRAIGAYDPDRVRPKNASGLLKNLRQGANGRYHWHWDPKMLIDESVRQREFVGPMTDVASGVKVPILLLRGERSDIVDNAGVEHFCELAPQTQVEVVPDARHMVAGDPNDDFSAGIIRFVTRTTR